jgi:hypothetical protein
MHLHLRLGRAHQSPVDWRAQVLPAMVPARALPVQQLVLAQGKMLRQE